MSGLISSERRVGADERVVERRQHLAELADLIAFEPERERELPRLKRDEAGRRVHVFLVNPLRRFLGDGLDLHAAVLARHDDRPAGRAIDDDAEVQLPRNRQSLLDEQPRHLAPFGTGLVRHEGHAVDLPRELVGLGRIRGELHAAALASPACVNLRFHDDGAAAEPLGHAFRLGRRSSRPRPPAPARRTSQEFVWLDTREFSYVRNSES